MKDFDAKLELAPPPGDAADKRLGTSPAPAADAGTDQQPRRRPAPSTRDPDFDAYLGGIRDAAQDERERMTAEAVARQAQEQDRLRASAVAGLGLAKAAGANVANGARLARDVVRRDVYPVGVGLLVGIGAGVGIWMAWGRRR